MIQYVPRADCRSLWDAYVHDHPDGWFWHTNAWLDYSLAYNPTAIDHSFAVMDHRRTQVGEYVLEQAEVVGVVPLLQEGTAFTVGGHPGPAPLGEWDDSQVDVTPVALQRAAGVTRYAFRHNPSPDAPWTPPAGARDISWRTTVLDLSQYEAALWRGLRLSHRQRAKRAMQEYAIFVNATESAVRLGQHLHLVAAGRETRPRATWDMMAEWATTGHLVTAIAYARNAPVTACGMAMAIAYKDAAYYGYGASTMSNVSHALIWKLALDLKDRGIRWFDIGWDARPGDTDKDRGISEFKRGFCHKQPLWKVRAAEVDL